MTRQSDQSDASRRKEDPPAADSRARLRLPPGSDSELFNDLLKNLELRRKSKDSTPGASLKKKTKDLDALRLEDHKLDHNLKRTIGYGVFGVLIAQVLITNVACVIYGITIVRAGGDVPTEALIAWMGATIVEVIALALVVTKYLFPEAGNDWNHERDR